MWRIERPIISSVGNQESAKPDGSYAIVVGIAHAGLPHREAIGSKGADEAVAVGIYFVGVKVGAIAGCGNSLNNLSGCKASDGWSGPADRTWGQSCPG